MQKIKNNKDYINQTYRNVSHQKYKVTGQIQTKVTYLSMHKKPQGLYIPKVSETINIKKEEQIDISLYRELYHKIGEPLTWTARKLISDSELSKKIHSPLTSIFTLRENISPIGLIEFEDTLANKDLELCLFGITPEAYGKQLGIYLLNQGIEWAWDVLQCKRLWLHTCDLDHEKALSAYLRSGFTIEKQQYEFVDQIALTEDKINSKY